MGDLLALLPHPAVAYGKAAIVGVHSDPEHGAAMIHPRLGKPMRQAVVSSTLLITIWLPVRVLSAQHAVPGTGVSTKPPKKCAGSVG
jgi:Amino acid synthesis